ncbi:MAG: ABC transporter ATP-binding protein [Acidimicrobiales bacterium]
MTSVDTVGGAVAPPTTPLVEMFAVTKSYGAVTACAGIDLALRPGVIHGILGQNGAGKSTLMKILIGLVLPDSGEIRVRGERAHLTDPVVASEHGIAMVHQHFSLVPALTVWENVVLGDRAKLDRAAARRRVSEVAERYGLDVDPDERVEDLSAGQRQRVEIVKCLRRDPSVLVLDEPTSVLTPAESHELFEVLRKVALDEGRAVALISHKLEEIRHATDEVTIMRAGRVVRRGRTDTFDAPTLATEMIGREVTLRDATLLGATGTPTSTSTEGSRRITAEPVLTVSDAVVRGDDGRVLLDGLSVSVRPGEIVGVAGVEGNGQNALGNLLSSLVPLASGSVTVKGTPVLAGRHGAMSDAGVGIIPEDRHNSGCVLDMTVAENLVLDTPHLVATAGVMSHRRLREHARTLIDEFEIATPSPDTPMWQLSGGNQQRVVLARELSRAPDVLVAAQPTRGLDVGAIEWMSDRLREAARSGVGVLLISTELEELADLADRIVVIYRGRIVGEMDRDALDIDRLGLLMGGAA